MHGPCERPREPLGAPGRIEFVCTGNLCRSPLAEGAARSLGCPAAAVSSSGLRAPEGWPCPPEAVRAGRRLGIELGSHRARRTDFKRLATLDWVAVMEWGHAAELQRRLGSSGPQVYLLGEFLPGGGVEIGDPYGGPERRYDEVFRLLVQAVGGLLSQLWDAEQR